MSEYISLLLNTGERYEILNAEMVHCENMFPNINVAQEFCAMQVWLEANPARRKTRRGIKRFIANWLIRATHEQSTPSRIAAECAVGRNHYGA